MASVLSTLRVEEFEALVESIAVAEPTQVEVENIDSPEEPAGFQSPLPKEHRSKTKAELKKEERAKRHRQRHPGKRKGCGQREHQTRPRG